MDLQGSSNPSSSTGSTSHSPLFHSSYTVNEVQQGTWGNCWWIAAVQAVENVDPNMLDKMLKVGTDPTTGEKTYTITFPGDPQHPVTLTETELTNFMLRDDHAHGDKTQTILELAAYKYYKDNQGLDFTTAGNDPIESLNLLLGNKNKETVDDPVAMTDYLNQFQNGKTIAVASTKDFPINPFTEKNEDGLRPKHAYSILSVDSKNKTVTLQDPWDTSKPITISYDVYMKNFRSISGTPTPLQPEWV